MNKEWSEKNKEIQKLLGREETFPVGIERLMELREELFGQITRIVGEVPHADFSRRPFPGVSGYHSKTLAYSVWHIFRIEDITAHELVSGTEQVLSAGGYREKTGAPILTTGNELEGDDLVSFSESLEITALYAYAEAVKEDTDRILKSLTYRDLKRKFTEQDRERVIASGGVSEDEKAFWLVDYWCGKDVRGLIRMPFSRHWIMHIEAMLRIEDRLCREAGKNVDRRGE